MEACNYKDTSLSTVELKLRPQLGKGEWEYFLLLKLQNLHGFTGTLQEHQWILTNATVSKVSDIENEWWSMRKIDF